MKSSSRPNLVLAKPSRPRSMAWRSSFVANLSTIAPKRMPAAKVKALEVVGHYRVAATTLVHNLIWLSKSSMLSHCMSSFLVSLSQPYFGQVWG